MKWGVRLRDDIAYIVERVYWRCGLRSRRKLNFGIQPILRLMHAFRS
ncbi:hypothetical protein ERO13_D08G207266v2 [Gossypium hirsutum]|nr:hypothetical protein ERO13_D08G207266v2 [Gossypium hirsutum]